MSTEQEPVVFSQAIEALARRLHAHITPEFKASLKGIGVDLDKLQTAYSLDTYSEFLRALGVQAFGAMPEALRHRALGREFLRGFMETPLGMAAGALAKVMGPRRALERMGRNFKQATNYLDAEFTQVTPTEVRLRTFTGEAYLARASDRSTRVAEYRRGLLEELLVQMGTKDSSVEIVDHHPERQDVTFLLRWR